MFLNCVGNLLECFVNEQFIKLFVNLLQIFFEIYFINKLLCFIFCCIFIDILLGVVQGILVNSIILLDCILKNSFMNVFLRFFQIILFYEEENLVKFIIKQFNGSFLRLLECNRIQLKFENVKKNLLSILEKLFECIFGILVSIVVELLKEFYKGENLNVLVLKVKRKLLK